MFHMDQLNSLEIVIVGFAAGLEVGYEKNRRINLDLDLKNKVR